MKIAGKMLFSFINWQPNHIHFYFPSKVRMQELIHHNSDSQGSLFLLEVFFHHCKDLIWLGIVISPVRLPAHSGVLRPPAGAHHRWIESQRLVASCVTEQCQQESQCSSDRTAVHGEFHIRPERRKMVEIEIIREIFILKMPFTVQTAAHVCMFCLLTVT